MKNFFKWTAIVLGVIIVALASIPFLFKDKIKNLVIKTINENIDATINFEDVDLSLFRSFPKADVNIHKLSLINKAPFEGDTLVYSEKINLKISVKELFNSEGEPINIEAFSIDNSLINVIFNKDGVGNFDIAVKDDSEKEEEKSSNFAMSLHKYEVNNLRFRYIDEGSNMKMILDSINHKGSGDFTNSIVDLDTYTTAVIGFEMGNTNYLNKIPLSLDAVLNLDLENSKYTFKENMALINKLPLEFDGYLQLKEEGQDYNLTFATPTTSFSNFLTLIPSAYSGSLNNIKTSGDFAVKGKVIGTLTENTIPAFDISMYSNNASFKYPDLPKSVEQITIDTKIKNETGLVKDTYVNLDQLSFKIDQDVFSAQAKLQNITENMLVDAKLNGVINLSNLSQAYPIKIEQNLSGIIKAYIDLNLDMLSVEQEKYENVKAQGTLNLSGFKYAGAELAKPLTITEADLNFSPARVSLNKLNAKTGDSDIQATGTLDNFYGFVFKDQNLKANFNLSSNYLKVSDFMTTAPTTETKNSTSEKTSSTPEQELKIPAFLDCIISVKANSVVYDNLTLKDVSGKLAIQDQTVSLKNVMTSIFGGKIGFDGNVSTKSEKPTFDMNLNLNTLDIAQSFTQLDMLKKIAPIAGVINGKINSTIKLNGLLDTKNMTPILNSLTGDLLGQLLNTKIDANQSQLLSALDANLNFIDLNKLNLNNLKAHLSFEQGKVTVKPINLKYEDIKIELQGTHGFDQNLNYQVLLDVPAKHLGKDASALLANLSGNQLNTMTVPIKANITGQFSKPVVQTDMKQAVTNLTNQIVQKQKNELIGKGQQALSGAVSNALGKDSLNVPIPTTKDELNQTIQNKKEEVKEKAKEETKNTIRNLLNRNK